MEQAWIDAAKALPGALLVGVPLVLAIRAIWNENKDLRAQLIAALLDKIRNDVETKTVLDKIAERLPRSST